MSGNLVWAPVVLGGARFVPGTTSHQALSAGSVASPLVTLVTPIIYEFMSLLDMGTEQTEVSNRMEEE